MPERGATQRGRSENAHRNNARNKLLLCPDRAKTEIKAVSYTHLTLPTILLV